MLRPRRGAADSRSGQICAGGDTARPWVLDDHVRLLFFSSGSVKHRTKRVRRSCGHGIEAPPSSRIGRSAHHRDRNFREAEHLAGEAVLFAQVSRRFPCKQGILQGNARFGSSENGTHGQKPAQFLAFLVNSLPQVTGKSSKLTTFERDISGKTGPTFADHSRQSPCLNITAAAPLRERCPQH